jgi:hypothetical protein
MPSLPSSFLAYAFWYSSKLLGIWRIDYRLHFFDGFLFLASSKLHHQTALMPQ